MLTHNFSSLYIRHLMQYLTFLSLQKVPVCHSSSVPACLLLCLKYVLPPSVLQFRNYTNLLREDSILMMENMSDFYKCRHCICSTWRQSPDSLKKRDYIFQVLSQEKLYRRCERQSTTNSQLFGLFLFSRQTLYTKVALLCIITNVHGVTHSYQIIE